MRLLACIAGILLLLQLTLVSSATAQGTAFTYQGTLKVDGQPANGIFDMRFLLYDDAVSGNIKGTTQFVSGIVVSNGYFTAGIDFGSAAFTGGQRWLFLAVRTNGATTYENLSPRQEVTPAPYAINAGSLSGAVSAAQIIGTLTAGVLPPNVVTSGPSGLVIPAGTITAGLLAAGSVSQTNLAFDSKLAGTLANIDAFGLGRYGWPRTMARLSTNGPLVVAVVGNGWAEDSDFCGFVTNLLAYKPLAGYASDVLFIRPSPIQYGPNSGLDTALFVSGDDTNWHGAYFVLTNTGNITAPSDYVTSDVCGVHYLANPGGGSFALDIRTNGDPALPFTNIDSTWTTVATTSAFNPAWQGRTIWWTNSSPVLTQVRVRATGAGLTPIVGFAQWNSRMTNGVILCQYSHQSSGPFWNYTDPNRAFPIWNAWRADLVFHTGGFDDSHYSDLLAMMTLLRAGFPDADIVNVGAHLALVGYTNGLERQYCFANGIPLFDGQSASAAAWGSYSNGQTLGLYQDSTHLSTKGYATFGQLLWAWMDLLRSSASTQLMPGSGLTTNITLQTSPTTSATFYFTNGLLKKIQ